MVESILPLIKWTTTKKEDATMKTPMQSRVPPDSSEALDVQGALNRLGGRKQLYDELLKKFIPECGKAHETISRHLAAGDMTAARRTAHTVKGASAAIGATVLSRAAEEIEKRIRHPPNNLSPYLMRFVKALNLTLLQITEYLENKAGPMNENI